MIVDAVNENSPNKAGKPVNAKTARAAEAHLFPWSNSAQQHKRGRPKRRPPRAIPGQTGSSRSISKPSTRSGSLLTLVRAMPPTGVDPGPSRTSTHTDATTSSSEDAPHVNPIPRWRPSQQCGQQPKSPHSLTADTHHPDPQPGPPQDLGSLRPVVPMSLYAKPSTMRDRLQGYKDSDDASTRRRLSRDVAALIERFFIQHSASLTHRLGSWDAVCIVPSTYREPPHPLARALSDHNAGSLGPLEQLLRRGSGELAHRKPDRRAFEPATGVAGRRVLLLDDVFTTGVRSQSAAFALREAGAEVPAIVVVARRINPDWRPEVAEWWNHQLAIPFSWST